MLTATYSLVAINTEHENTRHLLSALQHQVQDIWRGFQNVNVELLNEAFDKLFQFDEYFHKRKIELYVIPALRNTSREANRLLEEVEALSEAGIRLLQAGRSRLANGAHDGRDMFQDICHAMLLYCDHMFTRLTKEDEELFPLACRQFSVETWFAIAAQFLSEDGEADGRRKSVTQMQKKSWAEPSAAPMNIN